MVYQSMQGFFVMPGSKISCVLKVHYNVLSMYMSLCYGVPQWSGILLFAHPCLS